jgi:hypothetical protein
MMLAAAAVLCSAFMLPTPVPAPVTQSIARSGISPQMLDMDTIGGIAIALGGVGGGIALIALTEKAGQRNEEAANEQPCVVCKGARVVTCPVCQGTGRDQYADLVKGVREAAGEVGEKTTVITVDDWEDGPKQVELFKEILSKYPVKYSGSGTCINCDGRGVIVCDNCQGSGLQPRFLERYSPDDFMD